MLIVQTFFIANQSPPKKLTGTQKGVLAIELIELVRVRTVILIFSLFARVDISNYTAFMLSRLLKSPL